MYLSPLAPLYKSYFKVIGLLLTLSSCQNPEPSQSSQPISVLLKEGTNMACSLSPDGTNMIIDLQGSLWQLPLQGGTATYLSGKMGGCHLPTWSPDGTRILFHAYWDGNFHIYSTKADGSDLQQLTEGPFDHREADWSPDGTRIIFSSDRGGTYDVWELEIKSQTLRAVTEGAGNEYYPSYSPDGHQLAFLMEGQGIFLTRAAADAEQIISSSQTLSGPSWSPSGDRILFSEVSAGASAQYIYHLLSGTIDTLSVDDFDIFPFRASWISADEILYTADGQLKRRKLGQAQSQTIAFQAEVQLDRSSYTRKTYDFDDPSAKPTLGIRGPVLSPDGHQIAFAALGDLWIQEINGKLKQLTNDVYVDIDPDWSSDGTKIVFSSDRNGSMDLWMIDIVSDSSWLLAEIEGDAIYPSLSPDDRQLAFNLTAMLNLWGNAGLHLLDIKSGEIRQLHEPIFVPGQISWSPDGKFVAASALEKYSTRFREGISKIMMISLPDLSTSFSSPIANQTMAIRTKNGPKWSPDGKSLAFVQAGCLWLQAVGANGQLQGTPKALTEELAEAPSWSGDSKYIAYMATDQLKRIDVSSGELIDIPIDLSWKPQLPTDSYLLHAGKLFNGLQESYEEHIDIVIEGHRIKAIMPHQAHANDVRVIDASGYTVIPGMFDMHTHQASVCGEDLGRSWLAFGITTTREVGADPYDALERKEAWASGQRPGPRLFFTGGLTDGRRIYYGLANGITTEEHLKLELDRAIGLDYDLIKTYVRMPDTWQEIITQFAHQHGIAVSSHELYPAVSYGVDAVEHLLGTSRRGYSLKQSLLQIPYHDVKILLAKSGMSITPTLSLGGGMAPYMARHREILQHPAYLAITPASERASFEGFIASMQQNNVQASQQKLEFQQAFLRELLDAGGRITGGTDVPFLPYGWSLHVELHLYVEGGLTPFEALQSVMIKAAEVLGVEQDLGSIEVGKLADLVIVEGDPLRDITDAWKVRHTIKNGVVYAVEELMNQ